MEDHQSMFRDFFIRWNQETYILLRIRVIMGYLLFMYSWMFAMSGYVIRTELRSIVSFLDALSEILFVYILGAMQAAPFKNQLFPVWAICLINLRSSINYLSRYGTYFELRNMFKLLVVPFLIIKHGSKSWCIPLWLFWSLLVVECLYRILARYLASKSLWHGRSTELLQEYMGSDHSESFNPERCNPENMEGYKYLVYGESKQSRKTGHGLSIVDSRSLITLDKIWQCNGPLLRPINKQKNNMKDLTLAFSLSRLLRCTLEGAKLHLDTISMTQKLFCSLICADNAEKVLFGVMRLDLVFLRHYLHTSYPMVFCEGLLSFSITFVLFVVKLIMVLWILKDIGTVYHTQLPRPRDSFDILHYFITDLGITQTAMAAIGIMNSMNIYKYVASKWMILLLVCNYVNCGNRCMRYVLGVIIANFPVSPLQRWSEVKIKGHYDFLQSYDRRESKWELVASAIKESWTQRASMKRPSKEKWCRRCLPSADCSSEGNTPGPSKEKWCRRCLPSADNGYPCSMCWPVQWSSR